MSGDRENDKRLFSAFEKKKACVSFPFVILFTAPTRKMICFVAFILVLLSPSGVTGSIHCGPYKYCENNNPSPTQQEANRNFGSSPITCCSSCTTYTSCSYMYTDHWKCNPTTAKPTCASGDQPYANPSCVSGTYRLEWVCPCPSFIKCPATPSWPSNCIIPTNPPKDSSGCAKQPCDFTCPLSNMGGHANLGHMWPSAHPGSHCSAQNPVRCNIASRGLAWEWWKIYRQNYGGSPNNRVVIFNNRDITKLCHVDENSEIHCDAPMSTAPLSARFAIKWYRPNKFQLSLNDEDDRYCYITSDSTKKVICNTAKHWATPFSSDTSILASIYGSQPGLAVQGKGCDSNALIGVFDNPMACAIEAKSRSLCNGHAYIMYPNTYPSWQCRCCLKDSTIGAPNDFWDLYTAIPTKAPTRSPTKWPTTKTPTRIPTKWPTTKTPTKVPTRTPTKWPTTKNPTTKMPTTKKPTFAPTPTKKPTKRPTPATCTDATKNGDETDVDCGGSACPPCNIHLSCKKATDCVQNVCTNGKCEYSKAPTPSPTTGTPTTLKPTTSTPTTKAPTKATCSDGMANGNETDIDCGGNECNPCKYDRFCRVSTDCRQKVCVKGRCGATAAPTDSPTLSPTQLPTDPTPPPTKKPIICYEWGVLRDGNGSWVAHPEFDFSLKSAVECRSSEICMTLSFSAPDSDEIVSLGFCDDETVTCKASNFQGTDRAGNISMNASTFKCKTCEKDMCNSVDPAAAEVSTVAPTPGKDEGGSSTGIIAGAAGGACVLLAVSAVVFKFKRRAKASGPDSWNKAKDRNSQTFEKMRSSVGSPSANATFINAQYKGGGTARPSSQRVRSAKFQFQGHDQL